MIAAAAILAALPTDGMLPADATWAGVVVVIIAALFLAAATIGIVARATMPEAYVDPIMTEAEAGAPVHAIPDEH